MARTSAKTANKHVVDIIRRMAHGTIERAEEVFALSAEGITRKTAFIERFHGTMRERRVRLTRRSRHAAHRLAALNAGMWLVGCTSHWCWPHHALRRRVARAQRRRGDVLLSPAMVAGLTDHRLWGARAADVSDGSATLDCAKAARSTEESRIIYLSSVFEPTTSAVSLAQRGLLRVHQRVVSYRIRSICKRKHPEMFASREYQ